MTDVFYYDKEEIDDFILKSVKHNEDELFKKEKDDLEYLSYQLTTLKSKAKRLIQQEGSDHNVLMKKITMLEDMVNDLQDQISDTKLRLTTDEANISSNSIRITANEEAIAVNSTHIAEHQALLDEIKLAMHELDELSARIDEIEKRNARYFAYFTDKVTLNLDYSNEGRGLYNYLPFDKSIKDVVDESLMTELQKLQNMTQYSKCSKHTRCFSFSSMNIGGSNNYSMTKGKDTLFSFSIVNNDDKDYLTIKIDGQQLSVQKINEYGPIVYTLLVEFNTSSVNVSTKKITEVVITLLTDAALLDRAYKQSDTQYSQEDELYTTVKTTLISDDDMLTVKYESADSPVLLVDTRYYGISKYKDYATAHYTTQICVQLLTNIQQVKLEEERRDLYDKVNGAEGSTTLANLMLDVNMLKANSVRAVTAEFSLGGEGKTYLSTSAILPGQKQLMKEDYYGNYPQTDEAKAWWKKSDPYYSYRNLQFMYVTPDEGTNDASQSIQFEVITSDINETVSSIGTGRIRCYTRMDDNTRSNITSSDWKSFYDYVIHIPTGRDEIASDNDNGTIYQQLSMEPAHTGTTGTMYYSAILHQNTPVTLELKIYPSEVLPLTSRILSSKNLVLTVGDSEYETQTVWTTKVEKDGSTERLILMANVDVKAIFNDKRLACIPIASHDFSKNSSRQTSTVARKWATEGTIYATDYIRHTDGSSMYTGVYVSSPAGGHSEGKQLYAQLRTPYALPDIYTLSSKMHHVPSDNDLIFIMSRGWNAVNGDRVAIKSIKNVVTLRYIKDPIGIGSISYVDYALNNILMQLQSIQNQIVDIKTLIEKLDARLAFVESVVSQRQSFLSGALSALAMVTTYINPLVGVAVNILAQIYTVVEMSQKGITAEGVTYVLTNLLDVLLAIKTVKAYPPGWINKKGKYDVAEATARSQKQVADVSIEKYRALNEEHNATPVVSSHKVQIIHRPIEDFKYGQYFEKVLGRMTAGIESKQDKLIFSAATKMKINPTHQFMRTSTVRKVDGSLVKDVWVMGVGDGYSQMVNRSWLGWGNTALIPRKQQGELSPGTFKLSFKKESDGKWELLPHRLSGMTDEEILIASGMTKWSAGIFMRDADASERNTQVSIAYNDVANHYLYGSKQVVTKESNIQLMDGQMDALHNLIKKSSYDQYTYSLVGNNCQHFVDSTIKLLEQPTYRPTWMSSTQYNQYISSLDDKFAQFTS